MSLGKRIKEYRLASGLSQEDVAKAINSTKQAIYKYENEIVTNIPSDKIEIMAKLFHTSPANLMGWEEKPAENGELTEHEKDIIIAYRAQPEIQPAVDRLLGIEQNGKILLFDAAISHDHHDTSNVYMSTEKWKKIKESPDTDDFLL